MSAEDTASGPLQWIYQAIVERAQIGILVYQLEDPTRAESLRLIYANGASERATGADITTLIGLTILEAFENLRGTELPERYRQVILTQEPQVIGDVRYGDEAIPVSDFSVQASPIGEDCVVVTFRNVTDLREAQRCLEALTDDLNEALRTKQRQLIESEKLAVLGSLLTGIAHEMRTPLGAVASNGHSLGRCLAKIRTAVDRDLPGDPAAAAANVTRLLSLLESIDNTNETAVARLTDLVESLRRFRRGDRTEPQRVDLGETLESTLTLVHHELKHRIEVVRDWDGLPPIIGHPGQLGQVFTNILVNASQAIDGRGTITVRGYSVDGGREVAIEVADTGKGISEDDLEHIFDAGFTTKERGVGTGLGLAISAEIVHGHGGRIEVDSCMGQGTTFRIVLPVAPREVG